MQKSKTGKKLQKESQYIHYSSLPAASVRMCACVRVCACAWPLCFCERKSQWAFSLLAPIAEIVWRAADCAAFLIAALLRPVLSLVTHKQAHMHTRAYKQRLEHTANSTLCTCRQADWIYTASIIQPHHRPQTETSSTEKHIYTHTHQKCKKNQKKTQIVFKPLIVLWRRKC